MTPVKNFGLYGPQLLGVGVGCKIRIDILDLMSHCARFCDSIRSTVYALEWDGFQKFGFWVNRPFGWGEGSPPKILHVIYYRAKFSSFNYSSYSVEIGYEKIPTLAVQSLGDRGDLTPEKPFPLASPAINLSY